MSSLILYSWFLIPRYIPLTDLSSWGTIILLTFYKPLPFAMLMIRLARTGKTKKPYFRLIVSEKTKDTHGDYLEILGHVNPHAKPREVTVKTERVKYWLEHGAQASPSVHNILVDQGVVTSEKLRVWKPKKKVVEPEKPAEVKKAAAVETADKPTEEVKAEVAKPTEEVAPEVTQAVEEAKPAETEAPAS